MKRFLIHIILLSFFFNIKAQTFSLKQFTVDDGLPSSYIYDIAQDKDGFIWIATESGISKFDGVEFNNNPIPSIEQEEIVNLTFDSKDRLWMNSLNGQIIVRDKDNTHRLQNFGEAINGEYRNIQIKKMAEDDLGRIWLLDISRDGYRLDSISGSKVYGIKELKFSNNSTQYVYSKKDTTIFIGGDGTHTLIGNNFNFVPYENSYGQTHVSSGAEREGKVIFASPTKLNIYDPKTKSMNRTLMEYDQFFKSGIYEILIDKSDNLWISTSDGIIHLRKTEYGRYEYHHLLKGILAGQILEDNDGNIWFTSLREGLFFLPSNRINVINKEEGLSSNRITSLSVNNKNEIVVGSDENYINVISFNPKNQPEISFKSKLTKRAREVYDIINHSSGETWIFSSSGIYRLNNDTKKIKYHHNGVVSYKVGREAQDSSLWTGSGTRVYRFKDQQKQLILSERTYALAPINHKEAWIGSVFGLYHYSSNEGITPINLPELRVDIRCLELQENGSLWIATKKNGIIIYRNGQIIKHLLKENGLPSNGCKKIFLGDKYAWAATNSGIVRISYDSYNTMIIDINDGLPSREINDIGKSGNKIFVATNGGLAYFDDDIKTKDKAPNLFIKSIRINEKDTTLLPSYSLNYLNNNIKLSFVGLAYQSSKDVKYRVKMEGLDKEWLETFTSSAEYPSLSPGKYKLFIQSRTSGSEWSASKEVEFTITPPFWRRWWFILLAILIFLFFSGLIIKSIISRIKKENEIQESLKESRLTALRTQMNPHFMFNSLNSIQDFIIRQDKRSANKYLSKFSLLMRSILDMSDKNRIPLEKEIDALQLYLDLEALRFSDNFIYKIDIADNIDKKEVMLPSMLIQPYIENAIKHGLMHKKENRRLDVSFKLENNYLICEVDDNGIGRKMSKNIQNENLKTHAPKAMSVTEERLKLLNSAFSDNLNVDIIDKEYANGTSAGTKVIIYIEQRNQLNDEIS